MQVGPVCPQEECVCFQLKDLPADFRYSNRHKDGPTFAIIFMHMLESRALSISPVKPLMWFRFIDDIFSVWLHGQDKLKEFINFMNNRHNTINFTWESSPVSQNFLDVTVKIEDSRIVTDLFVKPTDTHQYLHPSSCH